MYASRVPFTRDGHKGPKAVATKANKATTPKPEPAKIEVEAEAIDLITEPQAEEIAEDAPDGDN